MSHACAPRHTLRPCLHTFGFRQVFTMDIHPACLLGRGLMFDHANGVVIGETAVVGDGCSFLHNVTLGGTGEWGDVEGVCRYSVSNSEA